jgi:hypothetical protein
MAYSSAALQMSTASVPPNQSTEEAKTRLVATSIPLAELPYSSPLRYW